MQTIDHLLLGKYLIDNCGVPFLHQHQRAFLLGCVEPDCNLFSYLRGIRHFDKLRGHNAENSFDFLARCTAQFEENGIDSAWDYFRFGTMLHYAADAFTMPHNRFWEGSLLEHRRYEARLHRKFAAMLRSTKPEWLKSADYVLLHRAYCVELHGMATDCRYILTACVSLTKKYLLTTEKAGKIRRIPPFRHLPEQTGEFYRKQENL